MAHVGPWVHTVDSAIDDNFTRKLHLKKSFIPELGCANIAEEKRKSAFGDRTSKGSTHP